MNSNRSSGNDSDELNMILEEQNEQEKSARVEFPFEVLTTEQVVDLMAVHINEVRAVIDLPVYVVRTLLRYFRWDSQKLLEELFDSNREDLFKAAGIAYVDDSNSESLNKAPKPESKRTKSMKKANDKQAGFCGICFQDTHLSQMTGAGCGHSFCRDCWDGYLKTKIMEDGDVYRIPCPSVHCSIVVDDDDVCALIKENKVKARYKKLITSSFVENHPLLRWCPRPDCTYAVKVKYKDAQPVKCICNTEFCFACGEDFHEPVDCDILRLWNKKSAGETSDKIDGYTINWIVTNTKECPKCHTTIEKNGGCNHITCKSAKCKYEFCWVCLGPWNLHGTHYYTCNKFDDSKAKEAQSAQHKARAVIERYMFYWQRFMNHKQSLKFENQLRETMKAKMLELQQKYRVGWVDVQFLSKAVNILCKCRQTLMYTYVFAYFCENSQQLNIFEDNQRDLQNAVEKMSEYLEQGINKDEMNIISTKVNDYYRYCENRRVVLINHISEGNDKNWWSYNVTI